MLTLTLTTTLTLLTLTVTMSTNHNPTNPITLLLGTAVNKTPQTKGLPKA